MVPSLRIPARDAQPGQILAYTYKNVDRETWVRAETVRKVVRHRGGRVTIATDYTTREHATPATVLRSNDTFDPFRL